MTKERLREIEALYERVMSLTKKSNEMAFAGRRLDESELFEWQSGQAELQTFVLHELVNEIRRSLGEEEWGSELDWPDTLNEKP